MTGIESEILALDVSELLDLEGFWKKEEILDDPETLLLSDTLAVVLFFEMEVDDEFSFVIDDINAGDNDTAGDVVKIVEIEGRDEMAGEDDVAGENDIVDADVIVDDDENE